ncbi:MAG: hypothetical protein Q9172_000428 [Xanthocarpia lactea]
MPATDSPAVLCARFLEANNYHDTLQAFLTEANLPQNTGTLSNPNDLTIEKILEEKKIFDLSLRFEKFGRDGDDDDEDGGRGWRVPAPEFPWLVTSLPSTSNLLHVSIEYITKDGGGGPENHHQLLFATTADRRLHILQTNYTFSLQDSLSHIHDSPILSCTILPLGGMVSLTTSMSGQVIVYDHRAKRVLDERRDHGKFVVRLSPPTVENPITAREGATQASQTRWKLAVEDQEDAAIRLNVNTFAPQTPYSTPQVCWRPDGSGVWVNGDDGVLRGFESSTGKICATLKGGHEPGFKIRSVWAGMVDVEGKQEEWLISGGFDKRLVVWKSCE